MQQVETLRDFRHGELQIITQLTVSKKMNGGKGYAYSTVRAVLVDGTRNNPEITELAKSYIDKVDQGLLELQKAS